MLLVTHLPLDQAHRVSWLTKELDGDETEKRAVRKTSEKIMTRTEHLLGLMLGDIAVVLVAAKMTFFSAATEAASWE